MLKKISSMKFGLVVMVLIIITSMLATLLPGKFDQTTVFIKIVLIAPRFLMLILLANLFFCTVQRLPRALKKVNGSLNNIDFKENTKPTKVFSIKNHGGYEKFIDDYFLKNKYRVNKVTTEEEVSFIAQKRKFSLLAPHLLHLGLIFVILGGLLGSFFGAEGVITAQVGETVLVPKDISDNMLVTVEGFQTLFDEQGHIDNWRSDLTVFSNGEKMEGITEVNSPLNYKGVVFYQTAYDHLHNISISVNGYQDIERIIQNRTFDRMSCVLLGELFLIEQGDSGFQLTIYEDSSNYETFPLSEGDTIKFPKGTLTYLNTDANTVLTVKKDPGTIIVMLGFIIMALSSLLFVLGRHREIKVFIDKKQNIVNLDIVTKGKALKEEITSELSIEN